MPTAFDGSITSAQAALDKLHALELAAMRNGDLATMNALQGDSNDLTLKLTQLRALAVDDDDAQIAALNKQLDAVTKSATHAQANSTELTSVLTNILATTKLLDSIIAAIPKT
jgi:hypothetical protein